MPPRSAGLAVKAGKAPALLGRAAAKAGGVTAKRGKIPAVLLPFFIGGTGKRAGQLQREKMRVMTP
jgi:hypothetical protein